ncbi:MAG: hypothetical protein GXW99_07930 [Clostridiales bacterium]|nr:hypothetical protein [Clostridiales bacterium]
MKSSDRKLNLTSYDDIFQTEESRADHQREKIVELPISELHTFPNHPFIGIVRDCGITPEMLAEIMKSMKKKPLPDTTGYHNESEEITHETKI